MAMFKNVLREVDAISKLFSILTVSQCSQKLPFLKTRILSPVAAISIQRCSFHSSEKRRDLMEFFDDKKNWGENEVKTGRPWRVEELRIKSNSDLHKIWFVLIKERNMLLTMEHECKEKVELFPNPERIDKVEESMENIETVVRERNKAYYLLETGEDGERPSLLKQNVFGLTKRYWLRQHTIPEFMNTSYRKKRDLLWKRKDFCAVSKFLIKYREQCFKVRRRRETREFNHVCGLLKRFPDMDMEALKTEYPGVDLDKAKRSPRSRGHRANVGC